MRGAAFVLLQPGRGELLAVTRPEGGWGLPGGGIDPGETPAQAAARELYEETGLQVEHLEPVYRTQGHVGPVTIFWASGRVVGTLRSSHEGVTAIIREEAVIRSRYGDDVAAALARSRRRPRPSPPPRR